MSEWVRMFSPVAMVTLTCVLAGSASAIAQDPVLTALDATGSLGGVVDVPVELTVTASGDVEAWSLGLCHDPAILTVVEVLVGSEVASFPSAADFFATEIVAGGIVNVAVLDFAVQQGFSEGIYEILVGRYNTPLVPTTTAVDICDGIGDPPIAVVVSIDQQVVIPLQVSAEVQVTGAVNAAFAVQVTSSTEFYDLATGAATFDVPVSIEQTEELTPVVGFTLALSHDAVLLVADSAAPSPALEALNAGAGPEFFSFESTATGIVVEVVTGESLLTAPALEVVAVTYSTQAAAVLAAGNPVILLEPSPVLVQGVPVGNSVAIFESPLTINVVPDAVVALVSLVPSLAGAEDLLYFGTGQVALAQLALPCLLNTLSALNGWSFGVCVENTVLAAESIVDGAALMAATGGVPPSFGVYDLDPEGWTSGVIVDFTGQLTLPAGMGLEIALATYEILDLAAESTVVEYCEIGSPMVEIVLVAASGTTSIFPQLLPTTVVLPAGTSSLFRRGDINSDGVVNALTDAIFLLSFGFTAGPTPTCSDAADANDDGIVQPLLDSIFLLNYQFLGGSAPPPPLNACGVDVSADSIGCISGCP